MIGAMPAVAVRHERLKQQKRTKWSSSLALQSPLSLSGLTMIGAMPAVAVRHERRKQEKRTKRPSQLGLQSPLSPGGPGGPGNADTISPDALQLQSPPHRGYTRQEFYVCGKVSVLHVVVVSLLLGAILVIVGLVQLTPGADASQHRYLLLAVGGALLLLGVLLAALRCCLLPWYSRRHRQQFPATGTPATPCAAAAVAAPAPTAAPSGPPGPTHTATAGTASSQDGSGPSRASSGRSRANSTTNGQAGRPRGSLSLCSPTGNQRRRSIAEAERGLRVTPTGPAAAAAAAGAAIGERCSDAATPRRETSSAERELAGVCADHADQNHTYSELSVVNEATADT